MSVDRFKRVVEARVSSEQAKNERDVFPLVARTDETVIVGTTIFETFPAVFTGGVELQVSGQFDELTLFVEVASSNPSLGLVGWRGIGSVSLPKVDGVARLRSLRDGFKEPGSAWWRVQGLVAGARETDLTLSLVGEVEAFSAPSFVATFTTPDGVRKHVRRYPGQSSNDWHRDLADSQHGNATKRLRANFITEAFAAANNEAITIRAHDERGTPIDAEERMARP